MFKKEQNVCFPMKSFKIDAKTQKRNEYEHDESSVEVWCMYFGLILTIIIKKYEISHKPVKNWANKYEFSLEIISIDAM